MKKSLYFSAAALLSLGAAVTACSDEDFGYTKDQLQEAKNFVEVFGKPDPDHTWSTASTRSISVDVQYPDYFNGYRCRVWTADPSRSKKNLYYMADLHVENGQSTSFNIDCPTDLQTVYVSLTDVKGGTIVMPATFDKEGKAAAKFGSLEQTRANIHRDIDVPEKGYDIDIDVYYYGSTDNDLATAYNGKLPLGSDGWGYFPKAKYDSYVKVFPENGGNTQNPPCESFVFQSTGEDIVLYPFYAVTNGKATNQIVFWVYNPADDVDYNTIVTTYPETVMMPAGTMDIQGKTAGSFAAYGAVGQGVADYENKDTKSRPYVITGVPEGWRVLFALKNAEGYFYSIKDLNDPANSLSQNTIGPEFTKGQKYSMAGTATIGADTYLAFEDTWYNGMYDCQDMAFAVYGAKAVDMNVGDGQALGFVVAYEDLGSTFDMDYNDIVLRVEHVTNSEADENAEKDVTVTLLAAGGTIPVVPMYGENAIFAGKGADSEETGEAHTVFGVSTDTPVNAGGSTVSCTPINSKIRVKEKLPITNVAAQIVMDLNYGSKTMKYTNPQAWGVTHPEDGNRTDNIPYAILISDPCWQWPTEHTLISSVYPKFKDWVTDQIEGINWYGAEWDGEDIGNPEGDVIGIVANTTFYESHSIAYIDPEFLNIYCTEGTTLHFKFENATVGAKFTVKSETGSLVKEGTVGAEGKATMDLTGDEFKKIYYKNGIGDNSDTKNTYYTITVFATRYGVSFGTEAELVQTDINTTNVVSDFVSSDGEVVSLTQDNGAYKLAASELNNYAEVVFTLRAERMEPYAFIGNSATNSVIAICQGSGLIENRVTASSGRPGIYQVTLTAEELATFKQGDYVFFQYFTNLQVAVKGKYVAGLAASDYTLGCNKSNIDLVANGTITTNSTGAITITTESNLVTINGTSISTGEVGEATDVTLNISQAATATHAAAETTMTLTIDPAALDPATLTITQVGELSMSKGETKNISECSVAASYNAGESTGAITYTTSSDAISVDAEGNVTANKAGQTAYVLIQAAADSKYAASSPLQYVKVTIEEAQTEVMELGLEYTLLSSATSAKDANSNWTAKWINYLLEIDMSGYTIPAGATKLTVKFTGSVAANMEFYADISTQLGSIQQAVRTFEIPQAKLSSISENGFIMGSYSTFTIESLSVTAE